MNFRLLGKSGLRVSELCLGTMTFGEDWGWGSPRDEARQIYDAFREAGGDLVDTANVSTNGPSVIFLGEFIFGHLERVVLGNKNNRSADHHRSKTFRHHQDNFV